MTSIASSTAAAAATSGATTSAAAQVGNSALSGLDTNFSTFLTMLMTQLKNQDPTTPLDASQFTTELVQFSGVEQQISTNTNLTHLISLTQASQVEQSSSMLGKPATVNSSRLALQNGHATINFDTKTPESLGIAVYNSTGTQIQTASMTSAAGTNSWQWDGRNSLGVREPDGAYKVTVTQNGVDGSTAAVPFTVTGTVTAVQNNNGVVDLQMGGLTVPFSNVTSVGS